MTIEPDDFRGLLSRFASGVTVVTTVYQEHHIGITVSSFSSVCLDPPLVSICVAQRLYSCKAIAESGHFVVNMLCEEQSELGKIFAGVTRRNNRFAGIGFRTTPTGAAVLPSVVGWLDCRIHSSLDVGDHTIFIGEVLGGQLDSAARPLVYCNRQWGRFEPLPEPRQREDQASREATYDPNG